MRIALGKWSGRLSLKLIGCTLAFIFFVTAPFALNILINGEKTQLEQLDEQGRAISKTVSIAARGALASNNLKDLENIARNLVEEGENISFVVIHRNTGSLAELITEFPEGASQRSAEWEDTLPYSSSIESLHDAQEKIGDVLIGISTRLRNEQLAASRNSLLLQSTVTFVSLIALLLWLIQKTVLSPIASLNHQAKKLASGDLQTTVSLKNKDELGELAETLDAMRRGLNDSKAASEESHQELQKALDLLTEALEESNAASKAKSDFLATISHELRTPMNGVLGMAGLLEETDLNDEQQELTDTIRKSGETLLDIISDILDFSKVESGHMTLDESTFNLRNLVEESLGVVTPQIRAKGLELSYILDTDSPQQVVGDRSRLRQVLLNLLGNAAKFTDQGEITLNITQESRQLNQVFLRFEVSDTGIGIPEGKRNCLFQAFSQVDSAMNRQYGGTGLGLVISKRLVELMGGNIGVNSIENQGSTFWFTIRFSISEPQAVTQKPVQLQNVRALVIDDNDNQRRALQSLLQSWEFEGVTVGDGREALRLLELTQQGAPGFDLIFIDADMPAENGSELAKAIKSNPKLCNLPLVLLSATGNHPSTDQLSNTGFADCLSKPVRQSRLFNCIADQLLGTKTGRPDNTPTHTTPEPSGNSAASAQADPNGPRILIAEDNPTNQKLALKMLQKHGYNAVVAENGKAAVEAWEKGGFDLILMDCQMPVMDGLEATRTIRREESEQSGHIPIVAMTANAMPGDREKCLAVGMDDYLSKPVKSTTLREALERWIGGTTAKN